MALASAPRILLANSQLRRPTAKFLIARSALLLSMLKWPSSRYLLRYTSWFNVYKTASPMREDRSMEASMECSHSNKASTTRRDCFWRSLYRSSGVLSLISSSTSYSIPILVSAWWATVSFNSYPYNLPFLALKFILAKIVLKFSSNLG